MIAIATTVQTARPCSLRSRGLAFVTLVILMTVLFFTVSIESCEVYNRVQDHRKPPLTNFQLCTPSERPQDDIDDADDQLVLDRRDRVKWRS